jgi:hypothetical protein
MWYPPEGRRSRGGSGPQEAVASPSPSAPPTPFGPPGAGASAAAAPAEFPGLDERAEPLRHIPGVGEPLPPFIQGGVPLPGSALIGDGTGGDDRSDEPLSEELRMAKVEAAMGQMPTAPRSSGSVWGTYVHYRNLDEMKAVRPSGKSSLLGRAGRDHRGLFAAGCALVIVVLTFFPFYFWRVGPAHKELSIWSTQYSGWYVAIAVVGVIAILVGLVNFLLRPGDPGALAVFILLRLLAVSSVALIACAMYFRTPAGTLTTGPLAPVISLRWPIFAALGAALIMLASSLATGLGKGAD